jgi:hypothetical protein
LDPVGAARVGLEWIVYRASANDHPVVKIRLSRPDAAQGFRETWKAHGSTLHVIDFDLGLRYRAEHRESHREPVIGSGSYTASGCTGATLYHQVITHHFGARPDTAQILRDQAKAIALFHPKLADLTECRSTLSPGRQHGEQGNLVYEAGDLCCGDFRRAKRARADHQITDRLPEMAPIVFGSHVRAHTAKHLQKAGPCGIHSHSLHPEHTAFGKQGSSHDECS